MSLPPTAHTNEHDLNPTMNDSQWTPRVRLPFHSLPHTHTHDVWNRLMPLMISRMMLSLKKASRTRESGWTHDALSRTHPRMVAPIEFGDPPAGLEESGGIMSNAEVATMKLGG